MPVLDRTPKTSDGKPIFLSAVFPGNQNPYYAGSGDDVAAGTRGGGEAFYVSIQGPNTLEKDIQYIDNLYIAGGFLKTLGGGQGDLVDIKLLAPATPVTSTPGAGNCAVASGLIIPTVNGDYTVDLDAALNANLTAKAKGYPTKVTKVVPIPAIEGNDTPIGWYDWNETTGAVTENTDQEGWWNLVAAEVTLTKWMTGWQLWDMGASEPLTYDFNVPTKARKILPHWCLKTSWNIVSSNLVKAVWSFHLARIETT